MIRALHPETIRGMASTTRWHTQNLLAHSAGVALLALFLAGNDLTPSEEVDLTRLALVHDAHETSYGDIPYPAKRELAGQGIDIDGLCRRRYWGGTDPYETVSSRVLDLVEVADVIEAATWAQENAPDIAEVVLAQAYEEAKKRLESGPLARALEALGIWGGAL